MTDKELHKLKRAELLEILLEQRREIERLNKQLTEAKIGLRTQGEATARTELVTKAVIGLSEAYLQMDPSRAASESGLTFQSILDELKERMAELTEYAARHEEQEEQS